MPSGVASGGLANAGRGIQQAGISNQLSGTTAGRANRSYNTLFPTLQQNLINPQGFGKSLPAINTAAQQSIGGATAGAVGQGNLTAARTRNAAGFAPALDEAVRSGQRTMSQASTGVQEANAYLKNQQQQQAISALGNMYGENMNDTLKALGLSNQALDISNQGLGVALGADKASPWTNFYDYLGKDVAGAITGQ